MRNVAGLPYGGKAFPSTVPHMTSRPGPIAGADVHMQGPEEVPANVKIAELERQLAAMRERELGSLARQQQQQMPVRPAVPDPHLVAPWQPNPLQQLAKAGPWQNEH